MFQWQRFQLEFGRQQSAVFSLDESLSFQVFQVAVAHFDWFVCRNVFTFLLIADKVHLLS